MNTAKITIDKTEHSVVLNEKQFSTGSKGYNGHGKMQVGEKRYQISINVVEIGSKPNKETKEV